MIKKMDMEYILTLTVDATKGSGAMENNMEKVFIERMAVIAEVSGRTVKESNGSMMSSGRIYKMLVTKMLSKCKEQYRIKREESMDNSIDSSFCDCAFLFVINIKES